MKKILFILFPFLLSAQITSNNAAFVLNDVAVGINIGGATTSSYKALNSTVGGGAEAITLSTLKAFPSAFGAGSDMRINPSTATIYEVTNLNDSGAGSFRAAYDATGERIIIIKVEGLISTTTNLAIAGSTAGDFAVWGQFAPGLGLTIDHDRMTVDNAGNYYLRFMTLQASNAIGCTVNVDCFDCLNFYRVEPSTSVGIDHMSFRYSPDQIWTLNVDETEANINQIKSFATYILFAEADPDHNTGSIMNVWDAGTNGADHDIGEHTFARNMFYNVSHRFPNYNAKGDFENYNNYIVNPDARSIRSNETPNLDYHRNFVDAGNNSSPASPYTNYLNQGNGWGADEPVLFSAYNSFTDVNTNVADNLQDDLWRWFDTEGGESYYGESVIADNIVPDGFFVTTRQHTFNAPADGYWDAVDVPSKMIVSVGHNRGINADGTPYYGYDDIDTGYLDKAENDTSESTYRAVGAWNNTTYPSTASYTDTDGDNMPDWFEDQFAFLNKNSSADMLTTNTTWDFSAISAVHNYIVTNNAGYTNLEMCAAFYAGDFETLIDGTNNLNIGDN